MSEKAEICSPAEAAWRAFKRADRLSARVDLDIPILFFGDLDRYLASALRVLTVGLNPSLQEFPEDSPFRRFPYAKGAVLDGLDNYLKALSAYFRTDPYSTWFNAFEHLLGGLGASYYNGKPSTALHTDICSPVATDPTWSDLGHITQNILEEDGGPLWHDLMSFLRPHIVTLSVAQGHLHRVKFSAVTAWNDIHVFDRTKNGVPRKYPVRVSARWYEVSGESTLFVFVPAAQVPLGRLSREQKWETGRVALEAFHRGP